MTKRTPLLLAVMILLPMLLLAWFGVRLQQDQQQVVELQLKTLVDSRLQGIDRQLQSHFFSLQAAFIPQARKLHLETSARYDAASLRHFISRSAQVEQMFVLSARGERMFPPQDQPLNRQEQNFVELTRSLLLSPERFTKPPADPQIPPIPTVSNISQDTLYSARLSAPQAQTIARQDSYAPSRSDTAAETVNSKQSSSKQSSSKQGSSKQGSLTIERHETAHQDSAELNPNLRQQDSPHGWIAWYAETGLRHIFWWQDAQGNTLGFALNSARLLSDLINYLPDSSSAETVQESAEIQLLNNRGEVSYSWGGYQHGEHNNPIQILPLSHPLGSWRLTYYATQQPVASSWLGLAMLLILLTAGLSTLAYLLYRDHKRELRLAEQRVNFVNQVSHELKTPLTNVRLYAEMLASELAPHTDEPLPQRYLGVITSEAQRLSRLIDNVLSFSRIKREGAHTRLQQGIIDACIRQIIQTFTPALAARNLTVRFEGQATSVCLFDAEALEQILNNLLSNCEKYAADGQFIDIRCWQQHTADGLYSHIRVRDYGPGVTGSEAESIFRPFYRISNKLTDGISGTGIGLGLARDLARAHGGDLVLECSNQSDYPEGACFLITLLTPLPEVDSPPAQQSEDST